MAEPESMFDKLGDLLSSALDSGFIFHDETSKEDKKESPSEISSAPQEQTKFYSQNHNNPETIEKPQRKMPAAVAEAFKKCGIEPTFDFTKAKQAYREKLMYYHPDRRNDNPVLQKVAREKTTALLENWKTIEDFFKNPYQGPSELQ